MTASQAQTVQVWNIQPRRYLGIEMRHEKALTTVAFDPRGESVLSASFDRTARLWNARTGQALGQPMRHQRTVRSADYSADGRRILTSCWSSTSRLWDANTGRPLTEWLDAGGAGFNACFDSTGRRIVSGAHNGIVRVWDAPPVPTPVPPWFLALAEAVAGTRLSARGNTELVSRQELEVAAQRLAGVNEGDFYERLAQWFLAAPSQRSLSPF